VFTDAIIWDRTSIAFGNIAAHVSPFDETYPKQLRQIIAGVLEDQEQFDLSVTRRITSEQVDQSYEDLLDEMKDQHSLIDEMAGQWEPRSQFSQRLAPHSNSNKHAFLDYQELKLQTAYRKMHLQEAKTNNMRICWLVTEYFNQQIRAHELRIIRRGFTALLSKYSPH